MGQDRPGTCAACGVRPRKTRGQAAPLRYCAECLTAAGGNAWQVREVLAARDRQEGDRDSRLEAAELRHRKLAEGYALQAAREAALDAAW